jgi:hypothetical protein
VALHTLCVSGTALKDGLLSQLLKTQFSSMQHSLTHSHTRSLAAPPDQTVCLCVVCPNLQVDSLLPTLTCRETLNFAEQCCGSSGHMGEAVVAMMSWEEAHKPERCPMDDEVGDW